VTKDVRRVGVAKALGRELERGVGGLDLDPGSEPDPAAWARAASWNRVGSATPEVAS
jgi:hypothetical protein